LSKRHFFKKKLYLLPKGIVMRIIKLTESDLEKIIKRILKEDVDALPEMENVPLGKVEAVQQALVNAGYDIGPAGVDGKFGRNTKNAVMKYQKDNGIKQTGNVGPVTSGKLGVQPLTSGKPTQKPIQKPIQKPTVGGKEKPSIPNKFTLPDFGNPLTLNSLKLKQDKTYVKKPINQFTGLKSKTQGKSVSSSGDYLMIIAFPQYEPKVDKGETVSWIEKAAIRTQTGEVPREGTYGKIGHAGIALISKTGDVKLFEFGRYNTKKGQGRVISKNLGKIAKIDNSGKFINVKEVAKIVKSSTQGDGPRLDMVTAVVPVPSLERAKAFAEGPAVREYEAVDMSQGGAANCGTFAIDTAKAGGVPIGDFCTPMPVKMISQFQKFSSDYFTT
jgi:peptidoglycan hydrolase-like protein with peptidoglycan-binding domain